MKKGIQLRSGVLAALGAALLLCASTYPDAPVADAAQKGDLTAVRALVTDGADVNAAQGDGMTALHWAAVNGDVPMVKTLLAAGAFPDATTRDGAYTPLHLAARAGRAGTVEALLEGGADAAARSTTGTTPLHFAAQAGVVESIKALLAHGAPVDATESASDQTPLIFAAAAGRTEAIEALLAAGADPSHTTAVVDLVARSKEDQELRKIRNEKKALEWGREVVQRGRPQAPLPKAAASKAAPGKAAKKSDEADDAAEPKEPVRPMGFIDLIGKRGGMTALLHAARQGETAASEALIKGGADINQQSADGTTPLLIAVINGHFDLAMRLLQLGADPKIASNAGATPLYATINLQWGPTSWYPQPWDFRQQKTDYLTLMEAFLKAGADPNARLNYELWYTEYNTPDLSTSRVGATPFWRAAYGTDVAAMKLLIKYGADPNIATQKKPGRSFFAPQQKEKPEGAYDAPPVPPGGPDLYPIHAATGAGYGLGFAGNAHRHKPDGWMPTLRYLVEELGADVNQRDAEGYTPLHNAASRGDNEMIQYLVDHGADVTVMSRDGQSAADMANGPYQRISPFPATVKLLESLGSVNHHNCVSC